MKKLLMLAIIFIVILLSACSSTKSQEFISEQGGFSVTSPVPLEESTQSIDSELGPIEVHFYMAEDNGRAYLVGYSDYPQDFIDQTDPQVLLDGARDGAVGNINGTLVSEIKVLLEDQYPGREIVAKAMIDQDQEGTLKERMFLVGNRLYQIVVITPSGEMSMQEIDDFIKSFQLLNQ